MNTAACAECFDHSRTCGIAAKLGYGAPCPAGGCALLQALHQELPEDRQTICPVETLARGDNDLVLWTLDELRRQMQRDPEGWQSAVRADRSQGLRHAAAQRRRP